MPFIWVSRIPAIVKVLAEAFTSTKLSDRVIACFENDTYLLFGAVFSSGLVADVANGCFCRCFLRPVMLPYPRLVSMGKHLLILDPKLSHRF